MSERAGRYQRSMAGMVGAMLVTLLVIIAFVAFRAVNRDDPDYQPEAVEYLPQVEGVQANDGFRIRPAYPPTLPDGWTATQAYAELDDQLWSLNLLTDEGRFLGVRQSGRLPVDSLVEDYVDEDAEEGGTVELSGALAGEWTEWTDASGDYALVRELGRDEVVLVVGTGDEAEIRAFAESLVVRPVQD